MYVCVCVCVADYKINLSKKNKQNLTEHVEHLIRLVHQRQAGRTLLAQQLRGRFQRDEGLERHLFKSGWDLGASGGSDHSRRAVWSVFELLQVLEMF